MAFNGFYTSPYLIDRPDFQLVQADLTAMQAKLTANTKGEGPNLFLEHADITKLKAAIDGTHGCDSQNLFLTAADVAALVTAGITSS